MEVEFLKKQQFILNGIYDGKKTYPNTKESFNSAIKKKYGLMFRIQKTKDNVLIVYADNDLQAFNLKDKIEDTSYDELCYLSTYGILTFEEALKVINGKCPIIIDIESADICKLIVDIIDNYKGQIAVISNDSCIIRWFNSNRSEYIMGEIITKKKNKSLRALIANCSIKTSFKSYDINYYDSVHLKALKEESIILGYLISTKEEYNTYKEEFDNFIIAKEI